MALKSILVFEVYFVVCCVGCLVVKMFVFIHFIVFFLIQFQCIILRLY